MLQWISGRSNYQFSPALLAILSTLVVCVAVTVCAETPAHPSFEVLTHRMDVDVDGAPNAYGPHDKPALDLLINAHYLERADQEIVGYLLDDQQRPILKARKILAPATTSRRQPSLMLPIKTSVIHVATSTPATSTTLSAATRPGGAG